MWKINFRNWISQALRTILTRYQSSCIVFWTALYSVCRRSALLTRSYENGCWTGHIHTTLPFHGRNCNLQLHEISPIPAWNKQGSAAPIPEHLFESMQQSSGRFNSARTKINMERGHNYVDISEDQFRPDGGIGIGISCAIIDLLRRIRHWGIARKCAATLLTLAQNDGDEDWTLITNDC